MKTTIAVAMVRDFFSDKGRNIHSKNVYFAWFSIRRHESLTRKINCYFFRCELFESVLYGNITGNGTALDGQKSCRSTRTVTLLSAYKPVRGFCGILDDVSKLVGPVRYCYFS